MVIKLKLSRLTLFERVLLNKSTFSVPNHVDID